MIVKCGNPRCNWVGPADVTWAAGSDDPNDLEHRACPACAHGGLKRVNGCDYCDSAGDTRCPGCVSHSKWRW